MGAVPADALVFYGATGDLAYKKIFPALHGMTLHGNLPQRVIAVAKSGWTLDQLRARAFESIERSGVLVREVFDTFAASLTYIDGDYGDAATFNQLSARRSATVCRPVHYLAIPPRLFGLVLQQLSRSGAARSGRVIVEKPFGRDLTTARELNRVIHETFDESDVYPDRSLSGKERGSEPPLLPFRQRVRGADLEPAVRRGRADHDGGGLRRRWSRISSTTRRAPFETSSRTTSCSCSPTSRWSRRPASTRS